MVWGRGASGGRASPRAVGSGEGGAGSEEADHECTEGERARKADASACPPARLHPHQPLPFHAPARRYTASAPQPLRVGCGVGCPVRLRRRRSSVCGGGVGCGVGGEGGAGQLVRVDPERCVHFRGLHKHLADAERRREADHDALWHHAAHPEHAWSLLPNHHLHAATARRLPACTRSRVPSGRLTSGQPFDHCLTSGQPGLRHSRLTGDWERGGGGTLRRGRRGLVKQHRPVPPHAHAPGSAGSAGPASQRAHATGGGGGRAGRRII